MASPVTLRERPRRPGPGVEHPFGSQTGYELVHENRHYPPKAVIGLACRSLLGRVLRPEEFSGGEAPGQANSVLRELGFNVETAPTRRKRDPEFRRRVLKAYEYRCAVCGFDVRLGSVSIALDAAHIRWHQAGGPDDETNGLALCVLDHKTFDLGAFTLAEGVVLVDHVHGTSGFHETLMAFHGSPVRGPQRPNWQPKPEHLA